MRCIQRKQRSSKLYRYIYRPKLKGKKVMKKDLGKLTVKEH
jgi:hypothetical protein